MKKKAAAAMAAAKAANPPRAILISGPDQGLLDMMVADLCAGHKRTQPTLSIEKLDDADLKSDNSRLAGLMSGASLFGDVSLVVLGLNGESQSAIILEALENMALKEKSGPVLLVSLAKPNKKGKLASLFDADKEALWLETYEATPEALRAYALDVAKNNGVGISGGALDMLAQSVSSDYASMRAEIEKLALYVGNGAQIDDAAVEALGSNSRQSQIDEILDACFSGDRPNLAIRLDQALAAGVAPVLVLNAFARRAKTLFHLRSLIDEGASAADLLNDRRFGIHFKRQATIGGQLRLWSSRLLAGLINAIAGADHSLKQGGVPAETVLAMFLTKIANRIAARKSPAA